MIDYTSFLNYLKNTPLASWAEKLPREVHTALDESGHGDLDRWQATIEALPNMTASQSCLSAPVVRIGARNDCDDATRMRIKELLLSLHPWRKGPFELLGIHIDSEWRSDMKWGRLEKEISSLNGRLVLDIGCGNGYYAYRMIGEGAHTVVGIDPTLHHVMQFHALNMYLHETRCAVLPLGIDDLPHNLPVFDTVFSMGVLYHRRDPYEHVRRIQEFLKTGGECVLETLVVEGGRDEVLVPEGRYAKMRNVFFIPSPDHMMHVLRDCGFNEVRCLDVSVTTPEEQRVTEWMGFESLRDFLDPNDRTRTIEGYPAPKRGIFIGRK